MEISYRQIILRVSAAALELGRTTTREVATQILTDYPDEMERHAAANFRRQLERDIKERFRDAATQDGVDSGRPAQFGLPGFEAPMAIAVPVGEWVEYVAFGSATWSDLVAGRQERDTNVSRASKRLEDWILKMDALQPAMEHDADTTVEAAARQLGLTDSAGW